MKSTRHRKFVSAKVSFHALAAVLLFVLIPADCLNAQTNSARSSLTAEMLAKPRSDIRFDDDLLWIFNGRARLHPRRYSLTGLSWPGYRFHFNFKERTSGLFIRDDTDELMKVTCPLGMNFRHGAAFVLVPQSEVWYPHYYKRTGTFHKLIKDRWVSFGIATTMSYSARKDEAFLTIALQNRSDSTLELELMPYQDGDNKMVKPGLSLVSDIEQKTDEGFLWNVPPKTKQVRHFALIAGSDAPVHDAELGKRITEAYEDGNKRIAKVANCLPVLKTASKQLDDFYRRCIGSMVLSKWEDDRLYRNPLWVVGAFQCIVAWDYSFCADALTMADPQAVRNIVHDVLTIGKMKTSYIGTSGAPMGGILYIQDPFALKDLINAYIRHTGDKTILDDKAADATVYEWMKRWANKLHNDFGTGEGGMIDVGYGTELLIEIRTDGYDHIVPVVNGLTIDLYRQLHDWAAQRGDPQAARYKEWADKLYEAFHRKLWDDKIGWFENMYADGSKEAIWTYHLFDLLTTDVITPEQRRKLVSHIREGVFLGRLGMYSISKLDTIHWDVLDCDFGGGGYYAGMPLRIARGLYEHGDADIGWDVLRRVARLADYFPYIPQSPRVDEPFEFRTGGNMQISSAAGLEAVWFGVFGIQAGLDGSFTISPKYHQELGEAKLTGFRFRGHRFDIQLDSKTYRVFKDGKLISEKPYGEDSSNLL